MAVRPVRGFPLSDDYATTRVPNAVLGRALSTIEDPDAIKLILRAIWLLERQRGYPRYITTQDLKSDRVLSLIFGNSSRFEGVLEAAIIAKVLIRVAIGGRSCLMLNTDSAARAALNASTSSAETSGEGDGWDAPAEATMPLDAFRAYEENIGVLTPMIRESILAALEDFTDEDITHAVRIAVEKERRSWSFVASVLRSWSREGIPDERRDGKSGGASDRERVPEAELRKYLEQQRKRDRASTP